MLLPLTQSSDLTTVGQVDRNRRGRSNRRIWQVEADFGVGGES